MYNPPVPDERHANGIHYEKPESQTYSIRVASCILLVLREKKKIDKNKRVVDVRKG